jgi:predicted unusual protein kinase regulating ubiquinone biosynthesis (AarF/ABC1/UbiB family)
VWTIAVYGVIGLVGLLLLGFLLLGRSRRLATGRLGRMARIGRLGARLWTSWLGAKVRRLFAGKARRARYDEERRRRDAEAVAQTMGQMKGAFMKLGQMMSFVSDSVPAEYRTALASLQAAAPPMDFPLLRDVAERELGRPLERAFARFDPEPLAAASIGQVHRAQLPGGEEVVVKIQYPGVAEAIRADLANAAVLYRMMGLFYPNMDPRPVVEELRGRIIEELDYEREARNQQAFYELYQDHPFIRVPQVITSHSSARVLTSEYVAGRRFADALADEPAARSRLGEILWRFVFGSIIEFGVFNGDPHPGNYLIDDQGRVVFLDYGCIKYFPEPMMTEWADLVRAHFAGEPESFRERAVRLGFMSARAPVPATVLYEYFGYFYEPFRADRDYTFTSAYNAASLRMVFRPEGEFAGLHRQLNMPPDFVFVNRIQWGVYSILAQLEATGNWHRIHREFLHGDDTSTELGRIDRAWRVDWLARRGLDASSSYLLHPDGLRPRRTPEWGATEAPHGPAWSGPAVSTTWRWLPGCSSPGR